MPNIIFHSKVIEKTLEDLKYQRYLEEKELITVSANFPDFIGDSFENSGLDIKFLNKLCKEIHNGNSYEIWKRFIKKYQNCKSPTLKYKYKCFLIGAFNHYVLDSNLHTEIFKLCDKNYKFLDTQFDKHIFIESVMDNLILDYLGMELKNKNTSDFCKLSYENRVFINEVVADYLEKYDLDEDTINEIIDAWTEKQNRCYDAYDFKISNDLKKDTQFIKKGLWKVPANLKVYKDNGFDVDEPIEDIKEMLNRVVPELYKKVLEQTQVLIKAFEEDNFDEFLGLIKKPYQPKVD